MRRLRRDLPLRRGRGEVISRWLATVTIDGIKVADRRGAQPARAGPQGRHRPAHLLLPLRAERLRRLPDVRGRGRARRRPELLLDAARPTAWSIKTNTPRLMQHPQDDARAAAGQPRPRLHDLRQERHTASCRSCAQRFGVDRVRFPAREQHGAAGPVDAQPRARPQQVHPLRRLRAGVLRGAGHRRDRLRLPRRQGAGHAGLRQGPGRGRLRQLRPVRGGLPDRRADACSSEIDAGLGGAARPAASTWSCRSRRPCAWRSARCSGWRRARSPPARWSRRSSGSGFDQVFDTCFTADLTTIEETNEFVDRAAERRAAAAVHLLLPGLGQVRRAVLPGEAGPALHLPLAAADVRLAAQAVLRRASRAATPRTCSSSRSCPARPRSSRPSGPSSRTDGRARRRRRADHAGAGAHDQGGRHRLRRAGGGVLRHAVRLRDRRRRDLRRLRRRGDGGRARGDGDPDRASASPTWSWRRSRACPACGPRELEDRASTRCAWRWSAGWAMPGKLVAAMDRGEVRYDIVEVMACPGGCAGGGGQPVPNETAQRQARARGLFTADKRQGSAAGTGQPADQGAVPGLAGQAEQRDRAPGAAHELRAPAAHRAGGERGRRRRPGRRCA